MKFYVRAVPVAKGSQTSEKTKKTYHNVTLSQGAELLQLSCSADVIDQIELYKPADLTVDIMKGEFQNRTYEVKTVVEARPAKA